MRFSLDESGFILKVNYFKIKKKINKTNPIYLKFENVQLVERSQPKLKSNGILYLTPSHLVFADSNTKQEIWVFFQKFKYIPKVS